MGRLANTKKTVHIGCIYTDGIDTQFWFVTTSILEKQADNCFYIINIYSRGRVNRKFSIIFDKYYKYQLEPCCANATLMTSHSLLQLNLL